MRKKLPKPSTVRKKCDALLTPIVKLMHPKCEACGNETQVAHHWIEKSRSSFLRYDLERNLIPLCHSCHTKIHNLFGSSVTGALNTAEKIITKRGRAWKEAMDKESTKQVKVDVYFYIANYERLKEIYQKLL